MLSFDKSYFYSEIRDGFYVSSKMKRTWAATLEVFEVIKKICEDHGLMYYADWGTMLGAIRHGGFIPWDDDFDICMKREDYMRFIQIAKEYLPEDYYLLSFYTDPEFDEFMIRVVNRKEITFGKRFMRQYHGYPYNIGVDIFPLDYVHDDEDKEKNRCDLAMKLYHCIEEYTPTEIKLSKKRNDIIEIAKKIGYEVCEGNPIRQQLYQMMDIIFSLYSDNEGHNIASVSMMISYHNKAVSDSLYKDFISVSFENTEVVVPLLYDEMLHLKYRDYMKCIRTWGTHQYPVYSWVEKEVHDYGRTDIWPNYSIQDAKQSIEEKKSRFPSDTETNNDVVFMPYTAKGWKWIEPLWLSMQDDPQINTIVMPIPYYDKDDTGEQADFHYEGNLLPQYVPIVGFDRYDLEKMHPSKIIIQNPYDNYDTGLTIPPFFYSERIKHFTDCLCYIPDFILDEFSEKDDRAIQTMDFFCTAPGVINADEVFVQSENMRTRYIEKLVSFAGNDTLSIWENTVKVISWDLPVAEGEGISEEEIPPEWWPKLLKEDGTGKKIILYYCSVSDIAEYREQYLDKVNKVLGLFDENRDEISVIWIIDDGIERLDDSYSEIKQTFDGLTKKYSEQTNIIIPRKDQIIESLAISDAFYGDSGNLMHRFERSKRPIMVQNVLV